MIRLNPDGSNDTGFGDDGFGAAGQACLFPDIENELSIAFGSDLVRLADGRILVAGAAALLASDGSPDPCFGDEGRWVQVLPEDHRGEFFSLVQGAGRVYLAGWADVPDTSTASSIQQDFMITAFRGLPLPDAVFADRFEQ